MKLLRTNIAGMRLRVYPGPRPLIERSAELAFMGWVSLRLGFALGIIATASLALSQLIDMVEWCYRHNYLLELWQWCKGVLYG